MARPDLRVFLERSLDVLAHEAPGSYRTLCATLAGREMCIDDGVERFGLCFETHHARCGEASGREEIVTAVDAPTLLALVDGETTLEEALRQERLIVRAPLAAAADAFDGLSVYLRGAIRCPSFPLLLRDLRGRCREGWPI